MDQLGTSVSSEVHVHGVVGEVGHVGVTCSLNTVDYSRISCNIYEYVSCREQLGKVVFAYV